jgi:hypothetical protein
MSEKINCAVIGSGGIGSYLAAHIDRLLDLNQIKGIKFTFFDDDKVEKKNILYQNFKACDIDSYKTEALEYRFPYLKFKNKRLSIKDLVSFDMLILCADNNIIRREAWQNYKDYKIPFIDSRANGKTVGIFSSDTENYMDTIDNSSESTSCQNPFQIAKEEIEFGNVVIAAILAQCILNYSRTKKLPKDLILDI